MKKIIFIFILSLYFPSLSLAATYYVSTAGSGSTCSQASPCGTITAGISAMSGGDTLIIGNGTYTGTSNVIRYLPNGTAELYTTIRAESDFGVLIDGVDWGTNSWIYGIRTEESYIKIQGFRVNGRQKATGGPATIGGDHIKIIRCGFWGGSPGTSNADTVSVGGDYILFEECYFFGGGRYGINVYASDHVVIRRCVSRNDYDYGDLQSAAFVNYDSRNTVFQNNIAIDLDDAAILANAKVIYSAFFFENKAAQYDGYSDTNIYMYGNIILNSDVYYAAIFDNVPAGKRIWHDNIIWDSGGGVHLSDYNTGEGTTYPPTWDIQRLTSGETNRPYNDWNSNFDRTGGTHGHDGGWAWGTGVSGLWTVNSAITKNSILINNDSYGMADNMRGNYNAYYGNGAARETGVTAGANDITNHNVLYNASTNPTGSLKYLPRGAEDGSTLSTAGENGGRVGAQVLWKIGVDGTLYGETGWNTVRNAANGYGNEADQLWPFPNEAQIKSDMAGYSGSGASGTRGFAASGKQLNGTDDITLTSYIWEYLGNEIPSDIYGEEEPVCDADHLELCTTEEICTGASLNWCDDACQVEECEEPPAAATPLSGVRFNGVRFSM